MKIYEMFAKAIDRDLKGVIKVEQDDEKTASQELSEYVVTKELQKHLTTFYSNYRKSIGNSTDKMGVWIKGYYGSGKSHFLKIVSYLLENRTVEGKSAISYFTEPVDGVIKITDTFLKGDMDVVGHVSCDVILFNIDSKSAINSKTNKDAILDVFIRVFNEHRGFCSNLPFVAELEKRLVREGNYEAFKEAFQTDADCEWNIGREEFFFNQDSVINALVSVGWTKESARTWCDHAEGNATKSIEKFATELKEYCKTKGSDHHIVFLVDEIGQYIGDDSKLMLNLQTVTEDLGTHCKGKAWIVVTSQEDIDSLTKVKGEDFSKIQARFDTRLSLSSANVGEVIRIRLLSKAKVAKETLKCLYSEKESILKNIIVFSDKTSLPSYRNADEFVAVYPFIPYQFDLLSNVLKAIHDHGASGKHLSEGERSMLAMFREAAISVKDSDDGTLVSFDLFYEALHTFLDHSHSSVILKAEENEHLQDFDVKVLKTLFMIKYVKEITANLDNLTTLLIDSVDTDKVSLRKKVEDSLDRLIGQTLVQKNGSIYIFLTNEEQDMNRAIEKMDVSSSEIEHFISEMIFDSILSSVSKASSSQRQFLYPYNRYIDEHSARSGPEQELTLYLLTANSDKTWTENNLITASMTSEVTKDSRLVVYLVGDNEYCREAEECLKIRKYLTRCGSGPSQMETIIDAKNKEATEREERVRKLISDALSGSTLYVEGSRLAISVEKPEDRIKAGLTELVDRVYFKLTYLDRIHTNSDILEALKEENYQIQITAGKVHPCKKAMDEIKTVLHSNSQRSSGKTTVKSLVDTFSRRPYGFGRQDVIYLLAVLLNEGSLTLKLHGEYLTCTPGKRNAIETYLLKKEYDEQILVEIREKVSLKQVQNVIAVMKDFSGMSFDGSDENKVKEQISDWVSQKCDEIKKVLTNYDREPRFPGKDILVQAQELLNKVKAESTSINISFFNVILENKEKFNDLSDSLNTVLGFFSGSQKDLFLKAVNAVRTYEDQRDYFSEPKLEIFIESIREIIDDSSLSIYSNIHKLPQLTDKFTREFTDILTTRKKEVCEYIDGNFHKVEDESEKNGGADTSSRVSDAFNRLRSKIQEADSFAVVTSGEQESDRLRNEFVRQFKSIPSDPGSNQSPHPQKKIESVRLMSLIQGMNWYLQTDDDIAVFTDGLKRKLSELLQNADALQVER